MYIYFALRHGIYRTLESRYRLSRSRELIFYVHHMKQGESKVPSPWSKGSIMPNHTTQQKDRNPDPHDEYTHCHPRSP